MEYIHSAMKKLCITWWNDVICMQMDGTGGHHVKQSKPGSGRQRSHVLPLTWKLHLKDKCIHKCASPDIHTCIERGTWLR
jgi:hypothetical protein